MRQRRALFVTARAATALVVGRRLVRAARPNPPLEAIATDPPLRISVVVPARDEAHRIAPLLDAVCGAPGVHEVIVVDDESTDDTAAIATAAGARVVAGAALPRGWAGKAWALQQGLEAANGDWIVTLDADTRPAPELARSIVARAIDTGLDLVTVAGRFECPTPGVAWLHPAMLTTLVYRFGPPGATAGRRDRVLANGQCMAFDRQRLLDQGGLAAVAGEVVEDVALARWAARRGWRVAMLDGSGLLTTRMFDDLPHTWHGWRRSLALPGIEPLHRQLGDVAVATLSTVVPLVRLLRRRAEGIDAIDAVLLAMRVGTLLGTRRAYRLDTNAARMAYALSPLADPVAVAALADGALRHARGRPHRWRGRSYPA